jgi:hypothetical protein
MRYEKSVRVQHEDYCCPVHLMQDILDTLLNEESELDMVHIISDKYTTEILLKTICQIESDEIELELQVIDFDKYDDEVDEYMITILDDGEVFVEKAINKNAEYYDCDGFMFVESEVSEDVYNGHNRGNDVMVFTVDVD